MFNMTDYQVNANQNCNEVSPHTSQKGHHPKKLQTRNAGESVVKGNPLANCWCECKLKQSLGEQYGGPLKK